jgi:hypothetical protein
MLARLLASMKDDDGKVQIEHFYDGLEPLNDVEKRAVAEVLCLHSIRLLRSALRTVSGG